MTQFTLSGDELRSVALRLTDVNALWGEWVDWVTFERRSPWLVVEVAYRGDRPPSVPRVRVFSRHRETGEWVKDETNALNHFQVNQEDSP